MSQPTRTDRIGLPTSGLHGHDLRRVQKLNDTLRRTQALVAGSEDAAGSIALHLAETRVLVLRMGRYEFSRMAGMNYYAVKNVETPSSHPQHGSLSRVYRTWSRLATSEHGPSSRVKKQLAEACAKFLDLLVPEEDEYGRPFRASVDGLYRTWMYQLGRRAFEAASRKTNRQRRPLTYGTLWQRREVGMVPSFEEVRVIGSNLGCDLKMAVTIWDERKTEQLLERGMPAPLVRFIVTIQLKYASLRMTAASIRKHLEVSEKVAQAINNGQLVGFDEIRHVVLAVFPRKDITALRSQWKAAWDHRGTQEDFSTAFPRICKENTWNNHMLATLLRVRPPEERSNQKKKGGNARAEYYKPSAEVRRMYQDHSFSGQAPALAAIELVASEEVSERSGGESQKEYLTRLFLEGVERRLMLKGSGAAGSLVRRHRILCGVMPQQLADLSGYSKADILLIERGLREVSAPEESRLVKLLETFPARKIGQARARLAELTTPPNTVRQAVARLKDRHGGYITLSRILHHEMDRRLSFTPARLKRIEHGEEVPALPQLRHLVTAGGTQFTPEMVIDWYDRMPKYLSENHKLRWRHPLVRGFGMVIFKKWHSLRHFWEEQFQDDFSYSIVTRNFQQLNGQGYGFPWTTVSRYLNAAGLGISDPRRTFLQQLFLRKDEVTDAINHDNGPALLVVIRQVLKRWRTEIRAAKGDPQSVEPTLGLTAEERGRKS